MKNLTNIENEKLLDKIFSLHNNDILISNQQLNYLNNIKLPLFASNTNSPNNSCGQMSGVFFYIKEEQL